MVEVVDVVDPVGEEVASVVVVASVEEAEVGVEVEEDEASGEEDLEVAVEVLEVRLFSSF